MLRNKGNIPSFHHSSLLRENWTIIQVLQLLLLAAEQKNKVLVVVNRVIVLLKLMWANWVRSAKGGLRSHRMLGPREFHRVLEPREFHRVLGTRKLHRVIRAKELHRVLFVFTQIVRIRG